MRNSHEHASNTDQQFIGLVSIKKLLKLMTPVILGCVISICLPETCLAQVPMKQNDFIENITSKGATVEYAESHLKDKSSNMKAVAKSIDQVIGIECRVEELKDSDLAGIENCKNLEYLWLMYDDITDAGLVHLQKMTQLKRLYVSGFEITDNGIQNLKNFLT